MPRLEARHFRDQEFEVVGHSVLQGPGMYRVALAAYPQYIEAV
jgi:hypothetical protein